MQWKHISRRPLVYLLPLLHFLGCIWIWVADVVSGVHYLILIDFPFSFIPVALGWSGDNVLFWFSAHGTLWCYVLSHMAQQIFEAFHGEVAVIATLQRTKSFVYQDRICAPCAIGRIGIPFHHI